MVSKLWEVALLLVGLGLAIKFLLAVVLPALPILAGLLAVAAGIWLTLGRRRRW